jgi:hypothetical protein
MTSKMSDTDKTLQSRLKQAQREAEQGRVPGFDAVWAAAERRAASGRKYGWMAGGAVAAAVVAFVTVGLLRPAAQEWEFINTNDFESSTSWVAPSDVLLPDHRVDIYREIPVLIESTKTEEGALL